MGKCVSIRRIARDKWLSVILFFGATHCLADNGATGRTFGLEQELQIVGNFSEGSLAQQLSSLTDLLVIDGRHKSQQTTSRWMVVADATLFCIPLNLEGWFTFELVSPILTLEDFSEVKLMTKALIDLGATPYGPSGEYNPIMDFHVHVDVSDLTEDDLLHLFANYVLYEPAVEMMVASPRRSDHSYHIHQHSNRNQPHFEGLDDSEVIEMIYKEGLSLSLNTIEGTYAENRSSPHKEVPYNTWRRAQLNFAKVLSKDIPLVEFRLHGATLAHAEIKNWITFVVKFVENGRKRIPTVKVNDKSAKRKFDSLFEDLIDDKNLQQYFEHGFGSDFPFCHRAILDHESLSKGACEARASAFETDEVMARYVVLLQKFLCIECEIPNMITSDSVWAREILDNVPNIYSDIECCDCCCLKGPKCGYYAFRSNRHHCKLYGHNVTPVPRKYFDAYEYPSIL